MAKGHLIGKLIPIEPGERFGMLVVVRPIPERNSRLGWAYLCECDCGNQTVRIGAQLRYQASAVGAGPSCGCLRVKAQKRWADIGKILSLRDARRYRKRLAEKSGVPQHERQSPSEVADYIACIPDRFRRETQAWLDSVADTPRKRSASPRQDWRADVYMDGMMSDKFEEDR